MKKSVIIALHVIFWVIFISMQFTGVVIAASLPLEIIGRMQYILYLGSPLYFYLSYFFIFPLVRHKKVALCCGISLLLVALLLFVFQQEWCGYYLKLLTSIIPWMVMGTGFRFFVDWINKDKRELQLSRQNLQSELALLRTQINPHFLFNSIHNIDTLILVDPAKASDSLIKLSDMMRYMLYDADADVVALSREVDYLQKYISLQMLRSQNKDLVSFQVDGVSSEMKIAPMLFIPFVENAFKHITDKTVKEGISISLIVREHSILFSIMNIFDECKITVKDATSGIGLSNVKRRLELIYPDKHTLNIWQDGNRYIVNLTIDMYAN